MRDLVQLKVKTTLSTSDIATDKNGNRVLAGTFAYTGSAVEPMKEAFTKNLVFTKSNTEIEEPLVYGTDYDLVYTDNLNSKIVSDKTSTVKLIFKGKYTGTIEYKFDIQQASATVSGKNIYYSAGKGAYDAEVKVVTKQGTKEVAVPTSEYEVHTTQKAYKIGDKAVGNVVFTNPNYLINNEVDNDKGTVIESDKLKDAVSVKGTTEDGCAYIKYIKSTLKGKLLTDSTVTAVVNGVYTYTGASINPTLVVKDGDTLLQENVDYKIISKTGDEAGDAYITIEGINNYAGQLTIKYTIEKADLAKAEVVSSNKDKTFDVTYEPATAKKPAVKEVKIGNTVLKEYDPITKKGDYELTYDSTAIDVGTYSFTITAVASSKKVQGTYKGTYKVKAAELKAYFAKKADPTTIGAKVGNEADKDAAAKEWVIPEALTGVYYTGQPITVDDFKTKVVVSKFAEKATDRKALTEGKDYRLEYTDNVNAGTATVKAYGLGNYAYVDENGKEVAIATLKFTIGSKKDTITQDMIKKINNVEYAGGLPVEPEVVIIDGKGNRLVQGVDYTVETKVTDVTKDGNKQTGAEVTIKGKGAYVVGTITQIAASITGDGNNANHSWKVTKKDMKNTTISLDEAKNVTVMNGTVVVPSSEYTVSFSEGKVTVTAKANSKNYTGSKEQNVDTASVGKAMISNVVVTGNNVTVVLDGTVENAVGYDYVIATENDYKNGRLPNGISKNQIKTETSYQYVQKGVYYAYCHAWKRNAEGKKVFGDWSNIYQFTVGATTPSQPSVTSVKVSGSTVKVTYTASANADGYDVVLGTALKSVNGEMRPVEYGKLVKKNIKDGVVTATFKNVPKGTYYAGLHAWNRTSVDNKKVFSPWSNTKKVTVK